MSYINPYKLFTGAMIPNWLMCRTELSSGAKLCYARLCQYADKSTGEAFPNQDLLAKEIGYKKRNLTNLLTELKKNGLIESIRLGKKQTNRYRFLKHVWMLESDRQDSASHKQSDRQDSATPMDRQDSATPYEENHEENHILSSLDKEMLFEEFWKEYPLKEKKKDSRNAFFKSIAKTNHEEIMRGLGDYKKHKPDWREWQHPLTWLRGEGWNDEYEKPPDKQNGHARVNTMDKTSLTELGL